MAAFPLSYYLAVRDSYLREIGALKRVEPKKDTGLPYEIETTEY